MKLNKNSFVEKQNQAILTKKIIAIGAMISIVATGTSAIYNIYFNPKAVAKRKFVFLATRYYEDFFYPKFTGKIPAGKTEEEFGKYTESGFVPVLLRQLLLFDNKKYSSYSQYFTGDYECDKSRTSFTVFPVSPYGKNDYRVEINLVCEEKE